jgi:AraC-like DNA-binding protein
MYAISIKLGMLGFFMDLPASETHDDTVDAINWSSREIFFLREQLFSCSTIKEGFLLIEQYLLTLIKNKELSNFDRIKWMHKAILNKSVGEICDSLGSTRKRLRRESLLYFGSSVKNIQGLIRFNQTLATIAQNCNESLSSLHDFYDQSHFINDFKARTGITPIQYKRLCQEFPHIKYTPNFLAMSKDTYLEKLGGKSFSHR